MKHQLPVFLHTAFIGLSKFVLGCVLWVALSIALYECLSWSATRHYPQDGAVSPLFLVPVHTQAGGLAFRHPNQIRPGEKPQNPPQETGAYFVESIAPDTFEATAEFGMGMAVMRYRIENDRVVPISFVHDNAGIWGTAAVGAALATAFLFWLAKLRIHYTQKTLRPYLLDSAGVLLGALQFAAWLAVSFALADGVMRLLPKTAWTAGTRDGVYFAVLLCSCGLVWLAGRKIKRNIRKRK